jgi:hypothetical protein
MSFTSIIAIWSHIFHQHKDRDQEELTEVIREKGELWGEYYNGRTHRGKSDSTIVKLEQVKQPDFNWQVVISWGLC